MGLEWFSPLGPAALVALSTIFLMVLVGWIIGKKFKYQGRIDVLRALGLIALGLVGLIVLVLVLPVPPETRGNILKIGGLLLTFLLLFSSTTIIRDLAAGLAMRFFSPFRPGDYLSTADHFGRVTEFGLIHTELQTIDRSLVTLANSKLLTENFKTIPADGTLVSVEVSLGYNIPHDRVEEQLLAAAESIGLEEPFVHVLELGNFAVRYRVAGLLEEVEELLTVRSDFRKAVLDKMHTADLEIVSPDYLNRRDLEPGEAVIPEVPTGGKDSSSEAGQAESVAFQKALEAQKVEEVRQVLEDLEGRRQEISEELKEAEKHRAEQLEQEKKQVTTRIEKLEAHLEELEAEQEGNS